MRKKPSKQFPVTGKKKPNIEKNPDSFMNNNPVWAFSRCVNKNEKWTIFCHDFYENAIPKMADFERMTWREIIRQTHDRSNKSSNHYIGMDKLSAEAKKYFPNYYDSETLFSLRIDNLRRLIGFLDNGTFYILWYDQKHEVVISSKKHT